MKRINHLVSVERRSERNYTFENKQEFQRSLQTFAYSAMCRTR
jgi:hypothetical protein